MAAKFDCEAHRDTLRERIDAARRLVDATKPQVLPMDGSGKDISREARGLAIVLLFASYENMLTSLCRSLLEAAAKSRARASRLKPGIRLFLVHDELQSLMAGGRKKLWNASGPNIVSALTNRPVREINKKLFPDDGSFMKSTQVAVFCKVFDFDHPAVTLNDIWAKIDTIVDQRNGIAHGRLTPDEVGRIYTHDDIVALINRWEDRWIAFLDSIEAHCSERAFYLSKS